MLEGHAGRQIELHASDKTDIRFAIDLDTAVEYAPHITGLRLAVHRVMLDVIDDDLVRFLSFADAQRVGTIAVYFACL